MYLDGRHCFICLDNYHEGLGSGFGTQGVRIKGRGGGATELRVRVRVRVRFYTLWFLHGLD